MEPPQDKPERPRLALHLSVVRALKFALLAFVASSVSCLSVILTAGVALSGYLLRAV